MSTASTAGLLPLQQQLAAAVAAGVWTPASHKYVSPMKKKSARGEIITDLICLPLLKYRRPLKKSSH